MCAISASVVSLAKARARQSCVLGDDFSDRHLERVGRIEVCGWVPTADGTCGEPTRMLARTVVEAAFGEPMPECELDAVGRRCKRTVMRTPEVMP